MALKDAFKPWWKSRGVWGALATLGAATGGLFGFDVSADLQVELIDHIVEVVALAGGTLALIGRIAATRRIR